MPKINLDFDNINYYKSDSKKVTDKWENVDNEIKNTFQSLGVIDAEEKYLDGVSNQYESEVVYHKNKTNKDIIFMSSDDALKYLMSYKGIGEKVASCILLFGYHRFDVFPIDTWVKKYMKDKYNLNKVSDIRKFMFDKYSSDCGLVIQYIFHFSRNIK